MSKETMEWLNKNVLVGFTDKRGHAWHYRQSDQGSEPNHYPGAIPVGDVERRLFDWEAVERPVYIGHPDSLPRMAPELLAMRVPDRKAIVRSDTGDVLGIFAEGYQPHQYREWLLGTVSVILDDSLSIGSAGLLRNGAQGWVSVEVPDSITTPEGAVFRPNLLACTSFDGSLATTFKRTVTNVVCDNTMAAGLAEHGQQFKVKHSRNSRMRIAEAREALAVVYTIAEDFAAEVKQLCETTVTDKDWSRFLEVRIPMPEENGRAKTMAENAREQLSQLWNRDERVAPWRNTAWGVMQAVNTYSHHLGIVRGMSRVERNMSRAVKGEFETLDHETIATLSQVLTATR